MDHFYFFLKYEKSPYPIPKTNPLPIKTGKLATPTPIAPTLCSPANRLPAYIAPPIAVA